MSNKRTIWNRLVSLFRAHANAAIDKAENPKVMLDQLVLDYTNNLKSAESASAVVIGNLRMLENKRAENASRAEYYGLRAESASRRADEQRKLGNEAEADKLDALARIAVQRQISAENAVKRADPQIAAQSKEADRLKQAITGMREKLVTLKDECDELVAREKVAATQSDMIDAVVEVDSGNLTSELSRFRERVQRTEALTQGKAEIAASNVDTQFEELEQNADVDQRFAALKAGISTPALEAK